MDRTAGTQQAARDSRSRNTERRKGSVFLLRTKTSGPVLMRDRQNRSWSHSAGQIYLLNFLSLTEITESSFTL